MDVIEELNELITQHADYLQVIERAEKQIGKFPSKVIEKVVSDYRSLAAVEKEKIQSKVNLIQSQLAEIDKEIDSTQSASDSSPELLEMKLLNEIGALSDDEYNSKVASFKANQDNTQQLLLQEQRKMYVNAIDTWNKLVGEPTPADESSDASDEIIEEVAINAPPDSEEPIEVDSEEGPIDNEEQESELTTPPPFDPVQEEPNIEDIQEIDEPFIEEPLIEAPLADDEPEEIEEPFLEDAPLENEVEMGAEIDSDSLGPEAIDFDQAAEDNADNVIAQPPPLPNNDSFVVSDTPPPPPVEVEPVFDAIGVSDIGEEMDFNFDNNEIKIDDEPALDVPDEFAMEDMEFDSIEAIEGPSIESESDKPAESRSAILLRDEGAPNEAMFSFTGESYTIGRSQDNDIQIKNDSKVSRHHCKLYKRNGHFYIEDQHSSNGTLINGELISERRLYGGEEIKIGETLFRFRLH